MEVSLDGAGLATSTTYPEKATFTQVTFVYELISTAAIIILLPILLRPVRQHPWVEWLLTVGCNLVICAGVYQRFCHINNGKWPVSSDTDAGFFLTTTLVVWAACVVLDGRHSFVILGLYGTDRLRQMLVQLFRRPTIKQTLQIVGTVISFLSLLVYGTLVFKSFSVQTKNHYILGWYIITTIVKLYRICIQGLMMTADRHHVLFQENKSFAQQLILTNLFSSFYIFYLSRFQELHWIPAALVYADVGCRTLWIVYQCAVYLHYWGAPPPQEAGPRLLGPRGVVVQQLQRVLFEDHFQPANPLALDHFLPEEEAVDNTPQAEAEDPQLAPELIHDVPQVIPLLADAVDDPQLAPELVHYDHQRPEVAGSLSQENLAHEEEVDGTTKGTPLHVEAGDSYTPQDQVTKNPLQNTPSLRGEAREPQEDHVPKTLPQNSPSSQREMDLAPHVKDPEQNIVPYEDAVEETPQCEPKLDQPPDSRDKNSLRPPVTSFRIDHGDLTGDAAEDMARKTADKVGKETVDKNDPTPYGKVFSKENGPVYRATFHKV